MNGCNICPARNICSATHHSKDCFKFLQYVNRDSKMIVLLKKFTLWDNYEELAELVVEANKMLKFQFPKRKG